MFSDSIWIAFADKEVTRMTVWGGDFGRAVRLARMARFAFYTSDGVAYGCDGPSSEHQYIKLLAVKEDLVGCFPCGILGAVGTTLKAKPVRMLGTNLGELASGVRTEAEFRRGDAY